MAEGESAVPPCLAYAVEDGGIGVDAACTLQIVADHDCCSTPQDIQQWEVEAIFDTLKVSLVKCGTVSKAMSLCKAARFAKWAINVGVEEENTETSDTFIADFAVAVGAGQFSGGGFESGEFFGKYNRLLEIQRENEEIRFVAKKFRC